MDQTQSVTDPLLLLQLNNADLLAEAALATMTTWERYTVAKQILVAAGGIYNALPPLPRDIHDDLCQAVSRLIAYITTDAVYEYLYDDEDRWIAVMEGSPPDDEWRMID